MQVHFDTFKQTGTRTFDDGRTIDTYSVEVTIRGDRRAVRCSSTFNNRIDIYDLAVKFQTGTKVWPGRAVYWLESGNVNHLAPEIDKRGHVSLVGFFEDYADKAVRSQHNAVA